MWQLGPVTLLFRWIKRIIIALQAISDWDASPFSVGRSIRTRPNQIWRTAGIRYDQATTIVTFSDPVEAQVHRESAGAPISLKILDSLMNLSG